MERLEDRNLLTGLVFPPREISRVDLAAPNDVIAADLDSDGDADIAFVSELEHKIGWYPNADGAGDFGAQRILAQNVEGLKMLQAGDTDGDQDVDIVAAFADGVVLVENLGSGFSEPRIIADTRNAHTVKLVDMDRDGDVDILWGASGEIGWVEQLEANKYANHLLRKAPTDTVTFETIDGADIDGDDDTDLIFIESKQVGLFDETEQLYWAENVDGNLETDHLIAALSPDVHSVVAADLDDDGDPDVVVGGDQRWFENSGGEIWFPTEYGDGTPHPADLDSDDDIDIVSPTAWFPNVDGRGLFDSEDQRSIGDGTADDVFVADLNGDDRQDVIVASSKNHFIDWLENTDGLGTLGPVHTVTRGLNQLGLRSGLALEFDLNGDGRLDQLTIDQGELAWNERLDELGTYRAPQPIGNNSWTSMYAVDFDDDDDLDVIASSLLEKQTAWFENRDGAGTFVQHPTTVEVGAKSLYPSDLDGDGDADLILSAQDDIVLIENLDGMGRMSPPRVVGASLGTVRSVFGSDIDQDGDIDILAASTDSAGTNNRQAHFEWYENAGNATFSRRGAISAPIESNDVSISASDLDDDGKDDLVVRIENRVLWHQNMVGDFGPGHLIANDLALLAFTQFMDPQDIDDDGDFDIVLRGSRTDAVTVLENRLLGDFNNDNQVGFEDFLMLAANFGKPDAAVADTDENGTVDFRDFLVFAECFGSARNSQHF